MSAIVQNLLGPGWPWVRLLLYLAGIGAFEVGALPSHLRRFSRLDDPALKSRRGTGVGLYNSWRIVQLHKGRITAESKHGAWARFSFEIPATADCAEPAAVDRGSST